MTDKINIKMICSKKGEKKFLDNERRMEKKYKKELKEKRERMKAKI